MRIINFSSNEKSGLSQLTFSTTKFPDFQTTNFTVPDNFEVIGFAAALDDEGYTIKWINCIIAKMTTTKQAQQYI